MSILVENDLSTGPEVNKGFDDVFFDPDARRRLALARPHPQNYIFNEVTYLWEEPFDWEKNQNTSNILLNKIETSWKHSKNMESKEQFSTSMKVKLFKQFKYDKFTSGTHEKEREEHEKQKNEYYEGTIHKLKQEVDNELREKEKEISELTFAKRKLEHEGYLLEPRSHTVPIIYPKFRLTMRCIKDDNYAPTILVARYIKNRMDIWTQTDDVLLQLTVDDYKLLYHLRDDIEKTLNDNNPKTIEKYLFRKTNDNDNIKLEDRRTYISGYKVEGEKFILSLERIVGSKPLDFKITYNANTFPASIFLKVCSLLKKDPEKSELYEKFREFNTIDFPNVDD